MFAQVVFQVSLCPVRTQASEDWLGPPTLQLGKRECPLSGLLMSENPKTFLSEHVDATIF